MKNNNTSTNEIRPKKDLCIKGLCIEIILACVFILSSILIDRSVYRQFRLCITALPATPASGKAHTPILLHIIRRSTIAADFRKYNLIGFRNPSYFVSRVQYRIFAKWMHQSFLLPHL